MTFTVIIPARFQSQRLPGKPLLDLAGQTMIERVYRRSKQSAATRVIVATDDERIARVVEDFNGEFCMTGPHHPSGTDRLQEVCASLKLADDEVIVNVQGDEPMIPPAVINQVAHNLVMSQAGMATLSEPICELDDLLDPNIVKVVTNQQGMALYFSRAPIPWPRDDFASENRMMPAEQSYQRHLGIYAYRVNLLKRFVNWPVSQLEETEKLEQLRAMWHGVSIHVDQAIETMPPGIDTENDVQRTLAALQGEK